MRHLFKLCLLCLVIAGIYAGTVSAQVVISSTTPTTEDGSAVLELQSPDMGLLIPKVTLDNVLTADPVTSLPVAPGLLIYNDDGLAEEGFYFWDGTRWTEVINEKRVFANEQFGELYEIAPVGTPTVVSLTTGGQWYGWTSSDAGTLSTGMGVDTINAYADKMTISRYGLYNIQLSMSIGGSQNQQITSSIFVAHGTDTETRIKVLSKISSAGDLISGSSIGVLELIPGDSVDLRFSSTNNGETLKIYSINLIVTKVGE